MIRILANLYKSRGEVAPVLTAADFRLDDDASGIGALLDSVSNEHHRTLRAKAQQNIISVTEAVPTHTSLAPHLQEILGALWLRSIAVGNLAGAEPATLQADITRDKAIDDNVPAAVLPEGIVAMSMSTSKLRLGPLPKTETVKLTIALTVVLKAELERYAALHAQAYGEPVDAATLIPHMLESFMARDRGFRKSAAKGEPASRPKPASNH